MGDARRAEEGPFLGVTECLGASQYSTPRQPTEKQNLSSRNSPIETAAAVLREAFDNATPVAPIRELLGSDPTVDDGYAIQDLNTRRSVADGRRISGRKIGVTSRAVQEQVGVNQPDFGTLFVDTEYTDGEAIDHGRLIQPRVEGEIALVLKRDLDDGPYGHTAVLDAIAYALPALEIVDSRITDWDVTIVDTIADNASCGVYVLGSRPVPLAMVDLRTVQMNLSVNGAIRSTGAGEACMGNPLVTARWLVNTMTSRGAPLLAGDVILTGSLGPLVDLSANDEVHADFGSFGSVGTHLQES